MLGSSFLFPWWGLLLVLLVTALLVLAVYARQRRWKIILGLSALVLLASCAGLNIASSFAQQVNGPAPVPATLSLAFIDRSNVLTSTLDTLNARTGALRWQQSFSIGVAWVGADEHTLYVTTKTAILAVRAQDGTVLWRTPLNPAGYILVAPVVADGMVYVASLAGTEETIEALDAKDGTLAWSVPHAPFPWQPLAAGAGRLYVGTSSGAISALRSTDGALVWSRQSTVGVNKQFAGPAYAGGMVYVADDEHVVAWRASDGTEVWSQPLNGTASTQLGIGASSIYVLGGSYPYHLFSFNSQTGRLQWKYRVDDSIFYATVSEAGSLVYFANGPALDALRVRDGQRVWRHSSTGDVGFGLPLLVNGVLFVRSFVLREDRQTPCPGECEPLGVSALNASTGSLYWRTAWSAIDPNQASLLGVTPLSS